jgi:type I restriction enzyme M protein
MNNGNGRLQAAECDLGPDWRHRKQMKLMLAGGIEAFLRREVQPYAADAWYDLSSVKVGCEIRFIRYLYKSPPMRTLEEIRADIVALEEETDGLLVSIIEGGAS